MEQKALNDIQTKSDFIQFIELLVTDLEKNPEQWENKDLKSFLEAIASWTEDSDGYYTNMNLPIPQNVNWKVFAEILAAARVYE